MEINIQDFEVFKFGENKYVPFINNNKEYLLNKEPYLDIVLTDYCNSNCNFCIADLIHDKLTCNLDIFKDKILYAIDNMNVKEVLLLGGEPTMSIHLLSIIQWLKSLNRLDKIVMTTNGIRLAQDLNYREEILSSGLTHINISFMNINPEKQHTSTNSKHILNIRDIQQIYGTANKYNVNCRINNNIYLGNNDSLADIIEFYNMIKDFCNSVKFSPLLETDSFSVIDYKTKWANENRLTDTQTLSLFNSIQEHFSDKYNLSIINNELQFGFVKNTLIPLKTPIILNWNFGDYTGMMKKVTEEHKINNVKLLPNNELSLSWNRELPEYFIKTQ